MPVAETEKWSAEKTERQPRGPKRSVYIEGTTICSILLLEWNVTMVKIRKRQGERSVGRYNWFQRVGPVTGYERLLINSGGARVLTQSFCSGASCIFTAAEPSPRNLRVRGRHPRIFEWNGLGDIILRVKWVKKIKKIIKIFRSTQRIHWPAIRQDNQRQNYTLVGVMDYYNV